MIAALAAGAETQAEIAERFGVSKSTVEKWWHRWQATGSCAAVPPAPGPPRTLQACEALIRAEVEQQPDVTLVELCERVAERQAITASLSMMCRTLQHLNLTRKKDASR